MGQLKLAKAKGTILTELKRIEYQDLLILDELASPSSLSLGLVRASSTLRSLLRRFGM